MRTVISVDLLPWVMLALDSVPKEDLDASPAELVSGSSSVFLGNSCWRVLLPLPFLLCAHFFPPRFHFHSSSLLTLHLSSGGGRQECISLASEAGTFGGGRISITVMLYLNLTKLSQC